MTELGFEPTPPKRLETQSNTIQLNKKLYYKDGKNTISSNYEVNIQKLNTPIEHTLISPGFHRIPRANCTVIFACSGYAHLVIPDLEGGLLRYSKRRIL